MESTGFGKSSGPGAGPPRSQPSFVGFKNPFHRPSSPSPTPRSIEPGWSNVQKPFYRDFDAHTPERSTPVTTFFASRDSTHSVTARVSRYPNPQSTRSPPISYADVDDLRNSGPTIERNNHSGLLNGDPSLLFQRPSAPVNYHSVQNFQHPSMSVQQAALSPRPFNGQADPSGSYANFPNHQYQSVVPPSMSSQNPPHNFTKELNSQIPKRTRSPSSPSDTRQEIPHKDFRRPAISPPRMRSTSNALRAGPHSQFHQKSISSGVSEATVGGIISSTASKRTRSPPSFSANENLESKSISSEDNSEQREMLAKAKRLARFKVELNKSEQNNDDGADQKASANRHEQSELEQKYVGGHLIDSANKFTDGHFVSDQEGSEISNVIVGVCPDMCPESERGERERKGDLDQYERVDGDRNVTSRFLAVKKYTRTAEREANLIRPMPILKKTIDYLLTLLDQPYDERFLGVYNFLWDRMRAIRMDLRMQHIFNQGAIAMLEQMIKLHIIAMHELCEYTKGEGFSEGFDAHLNIEQMNKTSVELFQLYDDHRKKGMYVSTEKEFRGYYALLKLDKHPGYKVEPAELSLDLAKMTPEIRQTPEVLFARNVARACRTGNFIAFFRLARKATYLQACLIHAHFAKLRTHALASLHSGLQNNQGLPVTHVANWLAMEDEGIEDLLEYHGFSLKTFEEPYMVREGPFLNIDKDYPTKRSKLVHKKRSGRIVNDVSPSSQLEVSPLQTKKEMGKAYKQAYKPEPEIIPSVKKDTPLEKLDDEMPDSEAVLSPKDNESGKALEEVVIGVSDRGKDHVMAGPRPSPFSFPSPEPSPFSFASPRPSPFSFPFPNSITQPQVTRTDIMKSSDSDLTVRGSPRRKLHSNVEAKPLEIVPKPAPSESPIASSFSVLPPVAQGVSKDESLLIYQEPEDQMLEDKETCQDKEIAEAKLKLFLRLWKRRVSKLRMLREQRQLASSAALNSLPLGPPIRHYIDQPGNFDKLDVDIAMRERYVKLEKSLARLNVSEVVAGILGRRNSEAKCLCWKVIVCSQINNRYEMGSAGWWLASKLMPSSDDDDVLISSHGLTVWRKWFSSQPGSDPTCCLSIVREVAFSSPDAAVSGASAVMFLVSEGISWNLQRVRLHNLLMSIPSGARLPLLILCGSSDKGFSSAIIKELGLQDIDKLRVSSFQLVFLIENQKVDYLGGFFSDQRLREGLQWLAGKSPSQPIPQCLNVRELVHMHINSLSKVQDASSNFGLDPNDCILLFNQALDCSLQEIIAAANSAPAGWPCPEIGLLDKSCDEDRAVKRYLPTLGWNSNVNIELIIRALQNCKLPPFLNDLSLLARRCKVGHEVENQRTQLENCLIQYLTEISKMMGVSFSTKEAHVISQTCARLELCGSSYRVVPHWGMVFRRIFNWRLAGLSSREISMAYISECHHVSRTSSDMDVGFETSLLSSYHVNPTLDEVISINFDTRLPVNDQPRPEALQHVPQRESNSNDAFHGAVNTRDAESNLSLDEVPRNNTACTHGLNNGNNEETIMNRKPTKEADKLSKLLEQCYLMQDGIDKKLYVYF